MSVVTTVLEGKCPKCKEGKIFHSRGNFLKGKLGVMNEKCPVCHYQFEKEPGYFLGAMYVSYALTVAEVIALFVLFFWWTPLWLFFVLIGVVLIGFSFLNFRLSRLIWIHMFSN